MARIEIQGGPNPHNMVIRVDGTEISGITDLDLHIAVDDVARLSIDFIADDIDIDAEALAAIAAKLNG